MKNGLRVYDADTHVSVAAEQLQEYLSPRLRELVPDLDAHLKPVLIGHAGEVKEPPFRHRYSFAERTGGWSGSKPRVLGEAEPRDQKREFQTFMGSRFPSEGGNEFADIRIKDMDEEGTDVHMLVPAGSNNAEDPEIEMEMIKAQHRWLADFCGQYPHRLKSMIVTTSRSIEESVKEIHTWGSSPWAVAVYPHMPLDYPLDHPDQNPIFQAAEEEGLVVIHHSQSTAYPGYRDMWDNPFMGRSASHPWGAMRFVASMIGSGILDRYPTLRFGVLESGFGWLPFWGRRLDDQVKYVGYVADLKQTPTEYLTSGRFFCSVEMHEGPEMVKAVVDLMGEDILMLGTDYPHAESRFPYSVDKVLAWEEVGVTKSALEKMLWDNPVRCFGEP